MAELNTTVTVGLTDELREAIAQAKRDRRERIATAVMAGFASEEPYAKHDECAAYAVRWADALIAALDGEAGNE